MIDLFGSTDELTVYDIACMRESLKNPPTPKPHFVKIHPNTVVYDEYAREIGLKIAERIENDIIEIVNNDGFH